jgi:two-component system response regulator AtoC
MAKRILIVDDESNLRQMLEELLRREGFVVDGAGDGEEALARLRAEPFDVVVTDLRMPGMSGLELLEKIHAQDASTTVIVMTSYGSTQTAVEAMKAGAYDYISKPFKTDEIVLTLRKAEERERLRRENEALRRELGRELGFDRIVHQSEVMTAVLRDAEKVAHFKSTVLVTGESGTGKELVARAIHNASPRSARPFVAVNVGAIPASLLESELFGHVRGAFTDAVRDRRGLFEEADEGTLFLDEIGELPQQLQVKLLRVLQEEEVRRVGGNRDVSVNVRVIAATARDLASEVKAGRFREDLFYRLNVMHVLLPALRERREDIPALAAHFLDKGNRRLGTAVSGIDPAAMACLLSYAWPGNVRELENVVERALVLAEGKLVGVRDLPERVRSGAAAGPTTDAAVGPAANAESGTDLSLKRAMRHLEERFIRAALERTRGNRTRAAELLEISPRALLYKLKEYGIH